MNKKKLAKLGVSLALVATVGVGATLAYLSATSDTLTNSFTVGDGFVTDDPDHPAIVLDEAFWKNNESDAMSDDEKSPFDEAKRTTDGNEYQNVLAGDQLTKDPTVHIRNGSVDSYVFIKVEGLDDLVGLKNKLDETLFSVEINDTWDKVKNSVNPDDAVDDSELDGIYCFKSLPFETENVKDSDNNYYQSTDPLFNNIVVNDVKNFLNSSGSKISLDNYNITITACAVQASAKGTTISMSDALDDATFSKQN